MDTVGKNLYQTKLKLTPAAAAKFIFTVYERTEVLTANFEVVLIGVSYLQHIFFYIMMIALSKSERQKSKIRGENLWQLKTA